MATRRTCKRDKIAEIELRLEFSITGRVDPKLCTRLRKIARTFQKATVEIKNAYLFSLWRLQALTYKFLASTQQEFIAWLIIVTAVFLADNITNFVSMTLPISDEAVKLLIELMALRILKRLT